MTGSLGVLNRPVLAADPRGEGLDAVDDGLEAHRVEEVEGVLGAGELGVQDRVGRHRTEVLDEGSGALGGRVGVVVAVDDEERWRVAVVGERGGRGGRSSPPSGP